MKKKNILIVGAGFAGIFTAKKLARKFKRNSDVQITLIDKHSYFTYLTELHEVAANRVPEDAIQYDLQRLFSKQKNVHLITDKIIKVDQSNKLVIGEHDSYNFDYLIIGIGSEPNDFNTPGVKEFGFTLGSWEQAIEIKEHIISTIRKGAIEQDSKKRESLLTISVVGSGFTGTETIGEFAEWKHILAKENKIDPDEIKLNLIEMAPTIMNMLDPKDAIKAERYMEKQNINVMKNTGVIGVHKDYIDLKDGSKLPTSTLIWTAGVKANSDANMLGFEQGKADRIIVNKYMQINDSDFLYAIGDVNLYSANNDGKGEPQIVQAAEESAETAAANVIAQINNSKQHEFSPNYQGFMVSIGSKYAVANIFNNIHLSGFMATLLKHMINIKTFLQLSSFYYLFKYLEHEFFDAQNERTVFGKLTDTHGNALWSLPLRLLIGGYLIYLATSTSISFSFIALILGITIFTGTLTSLSGIILFVLSIIWTASGFGYLFWLIPASLILLDGCGKVLGIDSLLSPFISKLLLKKTHGKVYSYYK
ncbi:NAD(P)/FAD-dependent oxidoreductase [Lactobacillus sp. YT155]|uniref:NAD(P)/FAD-dependent oxidoreductase n=1 Tax=Lactobacillus sp. YT155 TaxID=3060955 RepID=UPI00265FB291|nr:NAD(P)/FAD-dependent oxidoreductase [Lactobacillus sp. YT155]MDO1605506.1 NAD(P)/FAD-dependent oxidoreductase [Lactobacillus sp. YT155]